MKIVLHGPAVSITEESSSSVQPTSPAFNPPKLKFPKHIHTPIDEKFEKLAGTIFQHCNEDNAVYDMPQLPIEEDQNRANFARNLTQQYVLR